MLFSKTLRISKNDCACTATRYRKRGKSRVWRDKDASMFGIRNLWMLARDYKWKGSLEEAKTQR
jgi:hypothetical protein